jgi:hypothetical protein
MMNIVAGVLYILASTSEYMIANEEAARHARKLLLSHAFIAMYIPHVTMPPREDAIRYLLRMPNMRANPRDPTKAVTS